MKLRELVSIIIPCYNAEMWVAECIQSCLDQTYKNIEIIFVDDGSSDQSVEIVRGFQSPIIKIIEQKNKGACAARNRGLAEAQGQWIQYLDADDFVSPNKIEEQLRALNGNQSLMAVCPTIQFWEGEGFGGNKKADIPEYLSDADSPVDFIIRYWGGDEHVEGGYIWTSAWLSSRETLVQAGPWNSKIKIDQDGEYFCRVLLSSLGVRLAPLAVNYHRWRKDCGNLSARNSLASYEERFETVLEKEKHLLMYRSDERARRAVAQEFARIAIEANGRNRAVVLKAVDRTKALAGFGKDFFITTRVGRLALKIEKILGVRMAFQYLLFKNFLSKIFKILRVNE